MITRYIDELTKAIMSTIRCVFDFTLYNKFNKNDNTFLSIIFRLSNYYKGVWMVTTCPAPAGHRGVNTKGVVHSSGPPLPLDSSHYAAVQLPGQGGALH